MKSAKKLFWQSVQTLIGSMVGVGIFGLPFVFAQAGFGISIAHMVLIAFVSGVLLLAYADILRNTNGHSRLTGIVERYTNQAWGWFATVTMFVSSWGAMVAYIIIGGNFLHALFSPALGGSLVLYQLVFYTITAFLVIGGLGFITRLEVVFVFTLLVLLGMIFVGSIPHISFENFAYTNSQNWFLPFGVMIFAFGGLGVLPEMSHMLGKHKYSHLRKAIVTGIALVFVVYLLFSMAILGVSGTDTSEEAISGLANVMGNWVLILGSLIGLISVFTSFLILAIGIMDTLLYDFKQRYFIGWGVAVIVPLFVFLLGARSFIGVIGFTGGVLGGLTGLVVLYTYMKAKTNVCTTKRCLQIPNFVIYFVGSVYAAGVLITIVSVF